MNRTVIPNINASLEQIQQAMSEAEDDIRAEKVRQIMAKMNTEQMYITFCGHFSAGKSSLINHLCGHKLLPSSPIPTSANVVAIRNGKEQAIVKIWKEQERKNITLELLEQYCVNGSDIESIEIQYPIPALHHNITLLDTPGIDSTDDAHFASTDSALHLADVVFYVMDYNHVQSEINFNFAKRLQDMGKPLYLVVNQIDKHKDQELSFVEYRNGVKQSFMDWNINPQGIVYISVKEPNHPYNELSKLDALLPSLASISDELRKLNAQNAVNLLIDEHVQIPEKSYEEVISQLEVLQSDVREAENEAGNKEKLYKKEIRSLLDNANIIPALTRELIHHYLQSCKPGYKVGLFFTANKTMEEKNRRLLRFYQDFVGQISTHLEWHLQALLREQAVNAGTASDEWLLLVSKLSIEITTEWLQQKIQAGAVFSDEYTMNYAKIISSEVKEQYRQKAFEFTDQNIPKIKEKSYTRIKDIELEMNALSEMIDVYQYKSRLIQCIDWELESIRLPEFQTIEEGLIFESLEKAEELKVKIPIASQNNAPVNRFSKDKLRGKLLETAEQLKQASSIIEDLSSLNSNVAAMREKANRLEESEFTIALFGAFSAGKSSFANALLGERILPVSPNPTTAAINKIAVPNKHFPHGTAKIVMKTQTKIRDEIQFSLEYLGLECKSIEEALETIASLHPERMNGKSKPHYAFLRAVEKGWLAAKENLGKQLKVDLNQFKAYAANESQSCFVEAIELSYSCPFTEAGFIMVDTPGADSINARHTGVAFDYIKNADIILFVTYYNHAFSQADRDFLLQLGRVKDSFELDKMFFIINAADLASTDGELQEVVHHLDSSLVQYGIRNPRIYPVSSLKALEGKELSDRSRIDLSGISSFEDDFLKFTSEELLDLAVQSANQEIIHVIQMLEQRITAAQEGELERKRKAEDIRAAYHKIVHSMQHVKYSEEEKSLSKEVNELLYYVKQRVQYRFGELYNLAFNPSDLRDDTRDMKAAIKEAYDALIQSIAFNCSQEVLAATLRIEKAMNTLGKSMYEQLNQKISSKILIFDPQPYQPASFITPAVGDHLQAVEIDQKWLFSQFKNKKYFFEGEGKSQLKQRLEERLFDPISLYIEQHSEVLIRHYQLEWSSWIERLTNKQLIILEETVEGYILALEKNINIEKIKGCQSSLKQLLV